MRYQLLHQNKEKKDDVVLIAQSDDFPEAFEWNWTIDLIAKNPPREGYEWLMCNEESEYFECTFNSESVSPICGIMGVNDTKP